MQEKNMIFLKKKHVIPKQGGGGGVPHLGKIPTFSRFFFGGASLSVPGPYECPGCNRLLGFCLTITFLQCITFTIDQCTVSKRFDRISQQSAKMDFSSMILSISYEHLSIMMMIMLPSLDCPQYLHVIPNSPKNEH